jgi:hypothetical protein
LLGDVTSESELEVGHDKEVIKAGLEAAEKLNSKYENSKWYFKYKNEDIPRFHFLYRNRKFNNSEETFLGWERKRGLICDFNDFLINGKNEFRANTIEKRPNVKYVITLDSDTNLVLNSAFELVGAMSHVLNEAELSQNEDVVEKGYAIMQPKISTDLENYNSTLFTKIYAANAGIDAYSGALSDVYMDNFSEGIFTGKGIYDLKAFHTVLCNKIPENIVLSHDLLEGSYLRCALINDVVLLDTHPTKYLADASRKARWIRGDFQISSWII